MSNPAIEGSTPAASPSAALTLARTSLATNPLAAFLALKEALPALADASGPYAVWTRDRVNAREWEEHRKVCQALAERGVERPDAWHSALAYGDALSLMREARERVLEEAREQDDAEALKTVRALGRVGTWTALALADLGAAEEVPEARWLTLYRIELCDGGPEEGGWHYTWQEAVATLDLARFGSEEAARTALAAIAEASGLTLPAEGLRGYRSAAPEVDACIELEAVPFANQSHTVPRYE